MANSFFQFKQFTINQQRSAMKVCTDACIFGAYISIQEKDSTNAQTNILDIGAGTGLLSLMMAQKLKGNIDAVEIDEEAYYEALDNFNNSPWKTRLSLFWADVTDFKFDKKYDIIVSNPPFFNGSLKSNDEQKNVAKHIGSLSYAALASVIYTNLADDGRCFILLPHKEFKTFENVAIESQLFLIRKMDVRPTAFSNYFRTIGVFKRSAVQTAASEFLTIKESNEQYTNDFILLLKDYYLYL